MVSSPIFAPSLTPGNQQIGAGSEAAGKREMDAVAGGAADPKAAGGGAADSDGAGEGEGRGGAAVIVVRGGDGDVAQPLHRLNKKAQAGRVKAVIVGD